MLYYGVRRLDAAFLRCGLTHRVSACQARPYKSGVKPPHSKVASRQSVAIERRSGEYPRLLLTEDKDFGQLVFASCYGHGGVILLRYPFRLRHHIAEQLTTLVRTRSDSLTRSFTVIEPGRIRILPA
jgi:hypothetical protein